MAILLETVQQVMNRDEHLPGMITFSGPSGFGKSFAAVFATTSFNACYVQAQSSWTKKAFMEAIAIELGLEPAKTTHKIVQQIIRELVLSERPLIIDETDHIVEKKMVELIRDIYEGSEASIILIGEENLPNKLKKWERFHGRILDFVQAQAADLEDAQELAKIYCTKTRIADDLLTEICKVAKGSVRRICVNISKVENIAHTQGWDEITLPMFKSTNKSLNTGEAPKRRAMGGY